MPTGPAARIFDKVLHLVPGMLMPGPPSVNVLIGGKPAWKGLPLGAAGALLAAKGASDARVAAAQAATVAAAGTPGLPAAKAAEETIKATEAAAMSAMIASASGGASIHMCVHAAPVPLPPPHGPGVVIDGSPTVLINGLPACRVGDTILEAFGPPDKIMLGEFTVIIGNGAVVSGLGPDVDALVNMSPTLQGKLAALMADGWKIETREGGGSECDKENKTITIDIGPGETTESKTQSLAHEVGHAAYEQDPYVPHTGKTKDEYVDANLKRELKDEGEATLSNIEIRDEILEGGGSDIGIAGNPDNHQKYEDAYDDYKKTGDRDKAREDIGGAFADGETTSTTNESYRDYYGNHYKDEYDRLTADEGS